MVDRAVLPCKEVKEQIEKTASITILSHINPDTDALGTALGVYDLLSTSYKEKRIEVVNASKELPRHLGFLPNFSKIKHKIDYEDSLIITCDCGSEDRLGFELKGRKIINIDHHQSNTFYGIINVVKPDYASSSQVAFELFKKSYQITKECATAFYAALLSDTRFFTTSSVNSKVFSVAKDLVELGANPAEISKHFTQRRPLSSLRILQKALGSLTLYHEAKVAVLYVTGEDIIQSGATMPDMEGIVDYAKSLVTVEVALFIMETEEGLRISLRSKGADVSKVAQHFGGGGHKVAAGFTLDYKDNSHIQESIDIILKKITETIV